MNNNLLSVNDSAVFNIFATILIFVIHTVYASENQAQ